ncbi:glycosyltransferase family 2 protein [Falsiroseomonas sp.]|uniref:glycosyltransferase family 2 protein n=1 Tax=Falsiroseomonas sp. TaxID=2870721 RepID=UPI0035624A57
MRIAAFTMVYNEPVMLPLWARHYGREFGAENLFCLDHGSDDGSTAGVVANTIRLPRGEFHEAKRAAAISAFHTSLLSYYDAVVFSDSDEFLVADPARHAGLAPFIAARCQRTVTAFGFNVLPVIARDPPMDWHRPVLAQRRFACFDRKYCKTLISRVPLNWTPGFHNCDVPPNRDRDLYMFHLKFADDATFRTAQEKRMSVRWAAESVAKNHGGHWRRDAAVVSRRAFLRADPAHAPPLDDPRLVEREFAPTPEKRPPGGLYTIPERFRNALPGIRPGADEPGPAPQAGVSPAA